MAITPADFEIYKDLLYKTSGLSINIEKSYLLESRLSVVIKKNDLADFDALTAKIKMGDLFLKNAVVEAMTTNETFFFRDMYPFDNFKDIVLPEIMKHKPAGSTIRIWCAACASGQEPYSLGIILKENAEKYAQYKFEIIATDISDDILDIAKEGKYTQFEVQRGMPITLLVKYFKQEGAAWCLNDDVKSMVRFEKGNLLKPTDKYGTIDIIFCRNVLIYFDMETKTKVYEELHARVAKYGYLLLGGAETILGVTDKFQPVTDARGLYVPHDSICNSQ